MFPFDRFGAVHIIRILIEILLITFLHIFGSCRFGIIFGFNDMSSIIFSMIILLMATTDIYYLLLSIFTFETPKRGAVFHILYYSCMSLLALICCVFSIIAFIYCIENKYNHLCPYQSCSILWIGITLTSLLAIMYSASVKLLCCLRERNLD